MKINSITLHRYQNPLTSGQNRSGVLVHVTNKEGKSGWGDIAPLPKWSKETLEDSIYQLKLHEQTILQMDWTEDLNELSKLGLYPSVYFGVESALLSLLSPLPSHKVMTSALLMGSLEDILAQAKLREGEGFTSAKLKVNQLSFKEAADVIHYLKDTFRLRIDVNRAWKTTDALRFFSQFPKDAFDYVEEPFANPHDLRLFTHPLAIDESFPHDLSLKDLEALPTLKAIIYKPTLQGGWHGCVPLHKWAANRGVSMVLSSSFESDIGLAHVASIARRLSLPSPVGIGTYHHMKHCLSSERLKFGDGYVEIPADIFPFI